MRHVFTALLLTITTSAAISQVPQLPRARQNTNLQKEEDKKKDLRLPTRKSMFGKEQTDLFEERLAQFDLDLRTQPLETPIDPERYHVGPGDQFQITIWSTLENSIPARITPEGILVIPTIGALEVSGMTLAEVRELVKKEASTKYLNSEISADLVSVRAIRVHVTGQTLNPGTYSVLAVHRVSDAIELAGGLTSWAFERAIQIRHPDGSMDEIDLHQFKKLGNIDANIYLRGGDVIYIPSIDLNRPTVRIEGALNDPGVYELHDEEMLHDFLLRVDALSRRADLRNAYIERKNGNNSQLEIIPVFKYLENQTNGHSDLVLQDEDVINVPQRREDVYVVGAVRNPGGYPYIPGFSKYDYVGLAGSTENSSNPDKAKIFREVGAKREKVDDVVVKPGDVVVVPRRIPFGIREVLAVVTTVTNVLITMKALKLL